MAAQVDSKMTSYKSSLSSKQREILEAVEKESVPQVKHLFNMLSSEEIQEKTLDYVLLTAALKRNHKSLIKFLLTSGCRTKVEEKTKLHCAPLFYAFEKNDARIACDLIKKGASIHDKDANEKSPLEYAWQNKKFEMIDVILQNLKFVQRYENLNPDIEDNIALFHRACYKNKAQAVQIFIKSRFSVNSRSSFDKERWSGFTCLHFALSGGASYSDKSSVQELLKKDVDFSAQDRRGNTPVHLAFRRYDYVANKCSFSKKWLEDSRNKDLSNLEDQHALSFFHIMCCGVDDCEASKYLNAIKFFLKKGVNINKPVSSDDESYAGFTALHFSVRNFRSDVTELLLKNGADVTKTNKAGLTPLHMICDSSIRPDTRDYWYDEEKKKLKRIKIAKLLLEYGAEIDVKDPKKKTPIHHLFYSQGKNDLLMQFLLSKSQLSNNCTDLHGLSYLHIASTVDLSAVKTLIHHGAPIDSHVNSDAKVFPGFCALHFAVSFNKVEIVEYLLDHDADPNIKTEDDIRAPALYLATWYNFDRLRAVMYWDLNFDVQNDLETLHSAKMRIIDTLLKHGADINGTNQRGNTPLSGAVRILNHANPLNPLNEVEEISDERKEAFEHMDIKHRELIEFLLHNGADIQAKTNNGESLLHTIASQRGSSQRIALAKMFMDKGLDPNARNGQGLTPLHMLAQNVFSDPADVPLAQLLEKYGANINAMSTEYGTPLHSLIEKNSYESENHELLDYLLNHPDVNLDAQDSCSDTPLHMAAETCTQDQVTSSLEKLLSAGADISIVNIEELPPLHGVCEMLMINLRNDSSDYFFGDLERTREFTQTNQKIFKLAVTHFKKLIIRNVPISEKVREKFNELIQVCPEVSSAIDHMIEEELGKMKTRLINQKTSLYEIVLKNADDMAKYVNNENFERIIESSETRAEFSTFHDVLRLQFKNGVRKNSILGKARQALAFASNVIWPEYCADCILNYLSDVDLNTLIGAVSGGTCRREPRRNSPKQDESAPKRPRR